MELEPEIPIEDSIPFEYHGCELKRIGGHDVVDYWMSTGEQIGYYVIEYMMVLDNNKIGRTMVKIWINGPGTIVHHEVLQ